MQTSVFLLLDLTTSTTSSSSSTQDAFLTRLHPRRDGNFQDEQVDTSDYDDDSSLDSDDNNTSSSSSSSSPPTSTDDDNDDTSSNSSSPKRRNYIFRKQRKDNQRQERNLYPFASVPRVTVTTSQEAFLCGLGKEFSFLSSSDDKKKIGGAFWQPTLLRKTIASQVLHRTRVAFRPSAHAVFFSDSSNQNAEHQESQQQLILFHGSDCNTCQLHNTTKNFAFSGGTASQQSKTASHHHNHHNHQTSCASHCRARIFDESVHQSLKKLFEASNLQFLAQTLSVAGSTNHSTNTSTTMLNDSSQQDQDQDLVTDTEIRVSCAIVGSWAGSPNSAATAHESVAVDALMQVLRKEANEQQQVRQSAAANAAASSHHQHNRTQSSQSTTTQIKDDDDELGFSIAPDDSSQAKKSNIVIHEDDDTRSVISLKQHRLQQIVENLHDSKQPRLISKMDDATQLTVFSLHDASAYFDSCRSVFFKLKKDAMTNPRCNSLRFDPHSVYQTNLTAPTSTSSKQHQHRHFEPLHFCFRVQLRLRGTTKTHCLHFVDLISNIENATSTSASSLSSSSAYLSAARTDLSNTRLLALSLARLQLLQEQQQQEQNASSTTSQLASETVDDFQRASASCTLGRFLDLPTTTTTSSQQQQSQQDDDDDEDDDENTKIDHTKTISSSIASIVLVGVADGHSEPTGKNHEKLLATSRFGDVVSDAVVKNKAETIRLSKLVREREKKKRLLMEQQQQQQQPRRRTVSDILNNNKKSKRQQEEHEQEQNSILQHAANLQKQHQQQQQPQQNTILKSPFRQKKDTDDETKEQQQQQRVEENDDDQQTQQKQQQHEHQTYFEVPERHTKATPHLTPPKANRSFVTDSSFSSSNNNNNNDNCSINFVDASFHSTGTGPSEVDDDNYGRSDSVAKNLQQTFFQQPKFAAASCSSHRPPLHHQTITPTTSRPTSLHSTPKKNAASSRTSTPGSKINTSTATTTTTTTSSQKQFKSHLEQQREKQVAESKAKVYQEELVNQAKRVLEMYRKEMPIRFI